MKLIKLVLPLIVLISTGCASVQMNVLSESAIEPVKPNEAQIVFMRDSFVGSAIASSIYEVNGDDVTFLGILNNGHKIVHNTTPGSHMYMVVSEAADFMNAEVVGGKTYYSMITPRMGFWKARFSMWPVSSDPNAEFTTSSNDFEGWKSGTKPVAISPAAETWFQQNRASVLSKMREYMPVWDQKPATDKAKRTLKPEDGM